MGQGPNGSVPPAHQGKSISTICNVTHFTSRDGPRGGKIFFEERFANCLGTDKKGRMRLSPGLPLWLALFAFASTSSAGISVLGHYRLGEDDPAAVADGSAAINFPETGQPQEYYTEKPS